MDCTFTAENASLEVDVYEVIKVGSTVLTTTSLAAEYVVSLNETAVPPGGAGGSLNAVTVNTRGWTPFDVPTASAKGLKIIKKTKYFIKNGDTFTYQIRDPRNKWLSGEEQIATAEFAKAGWTRMLFIVAKAVIGTPAPTAWNLLGGCTRSYKYKVFQSNKSYEGTI